MKKTMDGLVISHKMQNTAIVEVVRRTPHPMYKKLIKREKRYKVDTKGVTVSEGDSVRIEETLPLSKDKNFRIIKVLKGVVSK